MMKFERLAGTGRAAASRDWRGLDGSAGGRGDGRDDVRERSQRLRPRPRRGDGCAPRRRAYGQWAGRLGCRDGGETGEWVNEGELEFRVGVREWNLATYSVRRETLDGRQDKSDRRGERDKRRESKATRDEWVASNVSRPVSRLMSRVSRLTENREIPLSNSTSNSQLQLSPHQALSTK